MAIRNWRSHLCVSKWRRGMLSSAAMAGVVRRLFVALLLVLCVAIHAVEVSGHWDRTLHDANDEAGLVAVVLCVGLALFVAGTLLDRIRPYRVVSRSVVTSSTPLYDTCRVIQPTSTSSPPLRLRI